MAEAQRHIYGENVPVFNIDGITVSMPDELEPSCKPIVAVPATQTQTELRPFVP